MNDLDHLELAMHAAVDPLTQDERGKFSDEMQARFPEASTMTANDPSAAVERAWQLANCRLLSDPLDPVGAAWSRFATSLREVTAR